MKPRLSGRTASALTPLSHGSRSTFEFLKTMLLSYNKFYRVLKLDVVEHTFQHSGNGGRKIRSSRTASVTQQIRAEPGIHDALTRRSICGSEKSQLSVTLDATLSGKWHRS